MVNDLNPLIRIRKHALEQKQKFLAELYRHAEDYERQKFNLLKTLEEEREKLDDMGPQMLAYFGPYSESVKDRVEEIDQALKKLNTRIEMAREDMRTAFAEMKKLQITQDRRDDEEQDERDKKSSLELDEVALEGFRRNQED